MMTRILLYLATLLLPALASAQSVENIQALRERSLILVNEERSAEGLATLELEGDLNEAALAHAEDMLSRRYFAHTSPEGGTVLDRYLDAGGKGGRVVRENLFKCEGCRERPDIEAVEQMHEGWMNSPGHRANILAEGLTGFGFAVVQDDDGRRYGVQTFAGSGAPRGEVPDGTVEMLEPKAQTELAARVINGMRDTTDTLKPDARLRRHVEEKLPSGDLGGVELGDIGVLQEIPNDFPWLRYQVLSGQCGGCGAEPTNSDVHFFLDSWQKNARSRKSLRNRSFTDIGFAIAADGEGRKIGVLLLAGQ
ncbi:CAP domain-containing protein [Hoeflea sp.]|uniref:CAP domain-containing protein n=1 Tax=Hoeflea sp. TaxID=1940281 RepID=UPI003B523ECD